MICRVQARRRERHASMCIPPTVHLLSPATWLTTRPGHQPRKQKDWLERLLKVLDSTDRVIEDARANMAAASRPANTPTIVDYLLSLNDDTRGCSKRTSLSSHCCQSGRACGSGMVRQPARLSTPRSLMVRWDVVGFSHEVRIL